MVEPPNLSANPANKYNWIRIESRPPVKLKSDLILPQRQAECKETSANVHGEPGSQKDWNERKFLL
jgi:hypothetical protein